MLKIIYEYVYVCVCVCVYLYLCLYLYLEKEMATHSSVLAWKSLWTEKPVRLQYRVSESLSVVSDSL